MVWKGVKIKKMKLLVENLPPDNSSTSPKVKTLGVPDIVSTKGKTMTIEVKNQVFNLMMMRTYLHKSREDLPHPCKLGYYKYP